MKTISAADANRRFSRLLREVRSGGSFTVTSHGTPVATIAPATDAVERRRRARDALLARLRTQPAVEIGAWTRDELYE